jgi:hypothetical protein
MAWLIVEVRYLRYHLALLGAADRHCGTLAFSTDLLSEDETSVLTTVTPPHIPEDGILHTHRHDNLKGYVALTGWDL